MEVILVLLKQLLLPIITDIVGDIFKKYNIDPDYVNKLNEANELYRNAKTREEKRKARINLIDLTRK